MKKLYCCIKTTYCIRKTQELYLYWFKQPSKGRLFNVSLIRWKNIIIAYTNMLLYLFLLWILLHTDWTGTLRLRGHSMPSTKSIYSLVIYKQPHILPFMDAHHHWQDLNFAKQVIKDTFIQVIPCILNILTLPTVEKVMVLLSIWTPMQNLR